MKPHGALYHAATQHDDYAAAVVEAMLAYAHAAALLCQPGTRLPGRAGRGHAHVAEGFVDRAYTADGLLVPRGEPGAVVTDLDEARRRAVRMAREGTVDAVDGTTLPMQVESLCVHSDSPGALEVATAVRDALRRDGIAAPAVVSLTASTPRRRTSSVAAAQPPGDAVRRLVVR